MSEINSMDSNARTNNEQRHAEVGKSESNPKSSSSPSSNPVAAAAAQVAAAAAQGKLN
jgi:hypothetical protein